jgi:hypothetical protein
MRFLRLLHEILREIFEESAYERFCLRNGITRDHISYARFLGESKAGGKVKCC